MKQLYKSRAHIWSITGIITQMLGLAGIFSGRQATGDLHPAWAGVLFISIGTCILCLGLYFYTLAKNRHAAWALAGLFSLPGFFLLYFLPDNSKQAAKKRNRTQGG
jgi:energy-converting hydrogenase Eha subunit C